MSRLPPLSGRNAATSIQRNGVVHMNATAQTRAVPASRAGRSRAIADLGGMQGAALEALETEQRQRQQDGDADHRRRRRLAGIVEFVGVLVDVVEQKVGG